MAGLSLAALGWSVSPLVGQTLPLQRDYPGSGPYACPTFLSPEPPSDSELAEAARLSSAAQQAEILGELEQAESLLREAGEADPMSADYAYRHGRALERIDEIDEAMVQYCRALSLDPDSEDLTDAPQRIDDLYEAVRERLPPRARDAFISGLAQADSSFYQGAISAFTVAMEAAPEWGAPVYNRAVMYEFTGMIQESLEDYRHYLDVAPTAVDPVVVMVSERIGLLEGEQSGTPSPGGAFVLGILPGMGQFYSSRPVSGTVFLTAAAGSVAAGLFVKEVTVECLNPVPAGAACPPEEIVNETTERPYLLPGLGVAAAATVIGAIEALVQARRRRAEAERITAGETVITGFRFEPPSVTTRGNRVDFNLVRVSF